MAKLSPSARQAIVVLAFVLPSGCSLFDTEGSEAQVARPPLPQALDGGAEPVDGAASNDAAPDAPFLPFCERAPHLLCAELSSPPVQSQWTTRILENPIASLEHEPLLGATQPGAADTRCPGFTSTQLIAGAYLRRDGDDRFNGTKWELEMAVRPESLPDEHQTLLARFWMGNAVFYLALSHQGVGAIDNYYGGICPNGEGPCSLSTATYSTKPLPLGQWSVLKLSIVPASNAGQPHRIVVAVNGVVAVERAAVPGFAPTPNVNFPHLDVGLVLMTGMPKERRILIDDVAFDVTP